MKSLKLIVAVAVTMLSQAAWSETCKDAFEGRNSIDFLPFARCTKVLKTNLHGITAKEVDICLGKIIDDGEIKYYAWGPIRLDLGKKGLQAEDLFLTITQGSIERSAGEAKISEAASEDRDRVNLRKVTIWPSALFNPNKDRTDRDIKATYYKHERHFAIHNLDRGNFPLKGLSWKTGPSLLLQCEIEN